MNTLKEVFGKALSFLYPPKCYICGSIIDIGKPPWFCSECEESVRFILPPVCAKCGAHIDGEETYCVDCKNSDESNLKTNYSFLLYEEPIRGIIHSFKYFNRKDYAEGLVDLALRKTALAITNHADIIIPVPLHSKRLKERGFNQAEELAFLFSERMGIQLLTNNLVRIRETQKQSMCTHDKRRENVKGAFVLKDGKVISGKAVMLVDDIYTTGSTLNECAGILLSHGATQVFSVTLAKTQQSWM